jgi:hypothetical protein
VNCNFHVTEISYDAVIWSTPEGNKIHFRRVYTADIPLIPVFGPDLDSPKPSRLIEECAQFNVAIKDSQGREQNLLVTQCDTLRDVQLGSGSASP